MDNKKIKIDIPEYPHKIIKTLECAGYDAFIVGGCVRDIILGKSPDDYDITTNAKPEEICKLFKRTINTGIKHGTVSVLFYVNSFPKTFEVTTYRIDGSYKDSRHPDEVKFVDDIYEDLKRRDFTINAMAYNEKYGLIDKFNGIDDLKNKLIRSVGNPIERFSEDSLRLMRAIRFSAKLGFNLEKNTELAIPILAGNLLNVSKERIQIELTKTLTSNYPEKVDLFFKYGLARYICKNFDNIKYGKFVPNLSTHLAYACLFYNSNIDEIYQILTELKFDNENIKKITMLIDALKFLKRKDLKIATKELINMLKYELVYDFIKLLEINKYNNNIVLKIKNYIDDYKKNKIPIFINELNISGNDLIELGFKGKEIGISLNCLLKIVYKNPKINDKNVLKEIAKRVYNIYKNSIGI